MKYDPNRHHRRSIRLRDYDYSRGGAYFVTVCVQNRECLFGDIEDGGMRLNEPGHFVQDVWCALPERFPSMVIGEFTVMPNHLHGIIIADTNVGALLAAPLLAAPLFPSQSALIAGTDTKSVMGTNANADTDTRMNTNANTGAVKDPGKGAASKGAASSAPTLGDVMRAFKSIKGSTYALHDNVGKESAQHCVRP